MTILRKLTLLSFGANPVDIHCPATSTLLFFIARALVIALGVCNFFGSTWQVVTTEALAAKTMVTYILQLCSTVIQ
jgi:hypothetical protein